MTLTLANQNIQQGFFLVLHKYCYSILHFELALIFVKKNVFSFFHSVFVLCLR